MAATDGGAGMPEVPVAEGGGERSLSTRASDRERDAVVQRVQDAFAEGRLDDAEFDERTRAPPPPPAHTRPAPPPRPPPGRGGPGPRGWPPGGPRRRGAGPRPPWRGTGRGGSRSR